MPNRNDHLLYGFLGGALGYILIRLIDNAEIKPESVLLAGGIGAVAGLAPDILEPAVNPNHRATFHSVAAVTAITVGANEVHKTELIDSDADAVLLGGIAGGYLSHLAADSTTQKGLPLI